MSSARNTIVACRRRAIFAWSRGSSRFSNKAPQSDLTPPLTNDNTQIRPRLAAACCLLSAVLVALLGGCGGSESAAEKFARNEMSIYVLDGGVSCSEISSSSTSTRYSCRADAIQGGVTQSVVVVVQCVDGGLCSRVPT